ncbi:hypothetical protein BTUL_0010g01160 [Botrytis tulipae]|uniref:Uncharacterized protein n=1 Tax=Botrytis tulipae TaxID=87230 RepID=A0A4Z1F242_9HELO|nr:hypothetical protein BTUL_0010g01160 [Botrytis tulipae]
MELKLSEGVAPPQSTTLVTQRPKLEEKVIEELPVIENLSDERVSSKGKIDWSEQCRQPSWSDLEEIN